MKEVITIWIKELKDTLRDKRTLFAMVIMPLFLIPGLIVGMSELTKSQIEKIEDNPIQLAIQNSQIAPELLKLFESRTDEYKISLTDDCETTIQEEQAQACLKFPATYHDDIANNTQIIFDFYSNSTKTYYSEASKRVSQSLVEQNQALIKTRFAEQKIDTDILNGFILNPLDIATDEQKGAFFLSLILPMMIVMWTIIGGQYAAIDLSAGEKERKTLEALLLTPITHLQIVAGKFLAVSTSAITSVFLSLISLYGAFSFLPFNEEFADFNVQPLTLLFMLAIGILLSFMFSALQLSVGIFAKSYKEAQSYISPLYMVAILPIAILNSIPDFTATTPLFLLPGINAVLLFKEILLQTYDSMHIILTIVSLLVAMAVSILIAAYIYSKESILFKE